MRLLIPGVLNSRCIAVSGISGNWFEGGMYHCIAVVDAVGVTVTHVLHYCRE